MRKTLLNIDNIILKIGLILVAFVTPLLFVPFTVDVFEFPKQIFLYSMVLVLLLAWLFKFILEGKVLISRTPLDLPILLFLAVYIVSTIFAPIKYTALFGLFGRFHGGLISILAYVLLYYIIVSNLKTLKDVAVLVWAFIFSSSLVAILGATQYFGFNFLPWGFAQIKAFTPVASPTQMAIFLSLTLILTLGSILYFQNVVVKFSLLLPALLMGMILILVNNQAAWFSLGTGLVIIFFFNRAATLKKHSLLSVFFLIMAGLFLVNYLPFLKNSLLFLKVDYPSEINLDLKSSWVIAINTVRDYPFWGSGPASFLFDFTRYRPAWFNTTPFWNIRFTAAGNEYFQILATLGFAGFLTYLLFIVRFLFFAFKSSLRRVSEEANVHALKVAFVAVICAYLVATLFTVSATVITIALFLILALLVVTEKLASTSEAADYSLSVKMTATNPETESTKNTDREIMPFIVFVPGILIVLTAAYFLSRYALGNFYYASSLQAIQENKAIAAYNYQRLAIQTDPNADIYRLSFAQTSLALANAISSKQEINDTDKQNLTALLDQAVKEARTATVLNPLNVNNWEGLAITYRFLAGAVNGAADWSLASFQQAIATDPPNPQLRLDLGGIFFAAKNWDQAIVAFRNAVNLKPNLANAHYNLANAFRQKEDYQNAWQEYTIAQSLVASDSADAKKLTEEMDQIKDKVKFSSPSGQVQPATQNPTGTTSGVKK